MHLPALVGVSHLAYVHITTYAHEHPPACTQVVGPIAEAAVRYVLEGVRLSGAAGPALVGLVRVGVARIYLQTHQHEGL